MSYKTATYDATQQNTASEEYRLARHRAMRRALGAAIMRQRNGLMSMEDARRMVQVEGEHYLGLKQVQVHKIAGSVNRYMDFDGDFNPAREETRNRWISVASAHLQQGMLPPVQLLKIGDAYFVVDGNHRVSVARHFGMEYIDAEVTEYKTAYAPVPDRENARRLNWSRLTSWTRSGLAALRTQVSTTSH